MLVPDLIPCKQLLLVTILLVVTSVATQSFSTMQDSDMKGKGEEHMNEAPGFVDNVYSFFSKMKSYVTGQNLETERRLEEFKKVIFQESLLLNQVLHKLEGNGRYFNGDASEQSSSISPLLSRKKRFQHQDFILHMDTVDNLVLSHVHDSNISVKSDLSHRNMDLLVYDDLLFFVAVNDKHQAHVSSFDSELIETSIDTVENVHECKFNKIEDISLLILICTPPFDDLKESTVLVLKFLKFADGNHYLFSHQQLRLEKPSTTHVWYQSEQNFLMIGQYEKFTFTNQSVYQTQSTMYHWTGSYFQQIEEGGTLPGTSIRSLLHFQAKNNHYLAMANFENNKGEHNIFSSIFKYSLDKERYDMWHHIPTKGAKHFAAFTLGTGMHEENFLVVANYCEDNDNEKCDMHTDSVIYIINSEKFSQFQCIQTHGAVQWLAIEVGNGVLLAVANSLTGAAFYQYNGWKFIQVDIDTEHVPALGPGISSITALQWNGNYIMGVSNSDEANLSLVYTLEFDVDTYLQRFHSDANKWCSGGVDYMKNGPQSKELIKTINEVPWRNSTYTFPNNVTFNRKLLINRDSTSRWIYIAKDVIRIPESMRPIIKQQNKLEMSLDNEEQILNNSVPLSHSWPNGLHLRKLIVESGHAHNISAQTIGGLSIDANNLICIDSEKPVTCDQLYIDQAHTKSDTALKYINEVLWSDLLTLSGNHWLVDGKTFSGNLSAVHLEVEGKFHELSFGHSQILHSSTTDYTGGIICDELTAPEVIADRVDSQDINILQQEINTNDAPVYTGPLHVNNSLKALGIITRELEKQNLEEIFNQAFMTNRKEKQTLLFDQRVNSASTLNVYVGDKVNGLHIPNDVLISSPVLNYSFDTATFTNLTTTSLGINHQLNDIKVINGFLDVISSTEREVQVVTAFKTFDHLNITAGMDLRNQTFENVDFIPDNHDGIRKRRSMSIGNSQCPTSLLKKLAILSPHEKIWHHLLLKVRTIVTSQLMLQQLNSASSTICLTQEEQMVLSALQHNVHCALNDLTIVDNILSLFKNKCPSGLHKKTFNKEYLEKVKGIVDNYRRRLEKNIFKILINPVSPNNKEKITSNLGNQLFSVNLILQLLYSNKTLDFQELLINGDNNKDNASHKTMLNSHIWYLLKNINILYKIQLVNSHSIFKLKKYTATTLGKENLDILIDYEMERIVHRLSVIESTHRNLCFLMTHVEKHLNSEEKKNIVFMLQMYKNKIMVSLLDDLHNQTDLHDQQDLHDPVQSQFFGNSYQEKYGTNMEVNSQMEDGGHFETGGQNEDVETDKTVLKKEADVQIDNGYVEGDQIEDVEWDSLVQLSRQKRLTNDDSTNEAHFTKNGELCIVKDGIPAFCDYHGQAYIWCWTTDSWDFCNDTADHEFENQNLENPNIDHENANETNTDHENTEVVYIGETQEVLYLSKNSTIVKEMLSNSRMVNKFLHRFDPILSLYQSVNSTKKLDKVMSERLVTAYDNMINVLNKILSNANNYILKWGDTEVKIMDGIVNDIVRLTKAFHYQLPNKAWKKIEKIKNIVPVAKRKVNKIQKILIKKTDNMEHPNKNKCSDDKNSESCQSDSESKVIDIGEEFITFYVLNTNYIEDTVNENVESCTPNSESFYDYLKVAQEYLSVVWEFIWFDVYVDPTKEKSIVSNKIREIINETTQIIDSMYNKDLGYNVLDSTCLKREINSLELAVEILRIVKVPREVKSALIQLKHHNELVELTSSITEKLHASNIMESIQMGDKLLFSMSGTTEEKQNMNDADDYNDSEDKKKRKKRKVQGNKQRETNDKSEYQRRRQSVEPMEDSIYEFTKKAFDFIKNFNSNSPMYILEKTNIEEALYYYSVNTILRKKYSHIISEDLKCRMEKIAERISDILLKLEVLKNVDPTNVEFLVKSNYFNRIRVPNLSSRKFKQDRKDKYIDFKNKDFKWSANENLLNNSEPNTPLRRFKREDNSTVLSDKLNNNVDIIDSVLIRYFGNNSGDNIEIRKKIQCFMETDDFNNVLLTLHILEDHLKHFVIQNTKLPSSASDSEHELHEKIEHFINYNTLKVLNTFNNLKENFGKSLSNINAKILSDEVENFNCACEIISAAAYIPCDINVKIECINAAIVDIQQILDVAKTYIIKQLSLPTSQNISSLCKTTPLTGNIGNRFISDTDVIDGSSNKMNSSNLVAQESSSNQSHVSIAIYDAEEIISYLHMFKKINPLPVLMEPSDVQSSKMIISDLLEVDQFLDSIIKKETQFINKTHFFNYNKNRILPLMFLKLKNAMSSLEEKDDSSINNVGFKILDNIFGTVDKLGKIEKAILEMELKKQQYDQVLYQMKLTLPEIDDSVPNVVVTADKVDIPDIHNRFSTVSGKIAGHDLREILSNLYLNETDAHQFMAGFDLSNLHNITISGSLKVRSHVNGIEPSILNRACPLKKPFNDITFIFNKPVIVENNLIAYYLSSISFENYATTLGKHVFYKELSFLGGIKVQEDVLVRSKVNDLHLYYLTTNIAQKNTSNIFKGNLTFNNMKSENIDVHHAMVRNVNLENIATLSGATTITGNKWFWKIRTNSNLTGNAMKIDLLNTKYNSNVKVNNLFKNNLRKTPKYVQVVSGIQVFRNLTFNVDVDVTVGIFDYTLNSLSKRAIYKNESIKLNSNLKTLNNTKIDNLSFFSSFDNVTKLDSWMMKDGNQYIKSFSSFDKLKAKMVKIKNDIIVKDKEIDFNSLVRKTVKINEPSILRNNIFWDFITVVGANISVDGLVQGVDISEETVVNGTLNVTLSGNKYFKRAVNFSQFFDIDGLFNRRNLDLFCSDYYFHNLTVNGDLLIHSNTKADNVTCHSKDLPEKNWESCWQADRDYKVKNELNLKHIEMFDGLFDTLSSNIRLQTFQNEVLWKKSSKLQSIKCVTKFSNLEVNDIKTSSLNANKIGFFFTNDLYDMFSRNDDQNITGFYHLNSLLMIENLLGPDTFNNVTLDHYCKHSKFCDVYAKKSMKGLYIEDFLKPHIDCVIQGVDISEWMEKATKTDSSPKALQNTSFSNLVILEALKTGGLVDGVQLQNLLRKSFNQTIEATLLFNNTSEDVLMLDKLDTQDGEINDYNLNKLVDRLVYLDKPAIVHGSTRFYNETHFKLGDHSKMLSSLKNAVDWIIEESAVMHLVNEVVTLSHLTIFANEALPRQPVKFEGWTVVQQIKGMYYRVKALHFESEDITPNYLALLSWDEPTTLLQHNSELDTYETSGIQIAGNCTTAFSAFLSRGKKYIINSNACGLNNLNNYLKTNVKMAFPFGISLNTSQGFSLIWEMQNKQPKLLWMINTRGSCDHQVIDLLENDLCFLLICHEGFDLRIMCLVDLENDNSFKTIQVFNQTYPIIKASAITHTNELGQTNNFLVMVDSQGLSLYMYDADQHKFTFLEIKYLQQLNWVDLVSHDGDLFISTISIGFRGLEKGMIFVYKLDFNHLEMQYNHTSVLLRFISPVSGNFTLPKMELYSSIHEDMPIESHFANLQTGELSLFVTSGTGVITRLSHHGIEGFRRSGDVLVPGSTTLEVWNSYRNGQIFTRLAPSGFPKMQAQKSVIMESSYLENSEDYSSCTIREL